MNPRLLSLLVVSIPLASSCRGPDLDDPVELVMTENLVEEAVELANERADLLCGCGDEYGFDSQSDCREYFDYLGAEEHDCLLGVFTSDPGPARAFLECATGVSEDLVECLEPWTCEGNALVDECHRAFRKGIARCPELPIGMLAELDSCTE